MYYLGVDAGTSKVKAAIISQDGRQIDMESSRVEIHRPFSGASEMDMEELWEVFCGIAQKLRQRNPDIWKEIIGVGVAGQGDGLWAIDADGKPVRRAILWNDTRTKELKIEREALDDLCCANACNVVYAGSWHILLRWIKEREEEAYGRIAHLFHCKDWLNYQLTGEVATDYSDASTALLNLDTREYAYEVLEALGIEDKKDAFPKLVDTSAIAGTVTADAARLTGLRKGTPVVGGAIDVAAVALGLGVRETGAACTIIGTTLSNQMVMERSRIDLRHQMGICHIPKGTYLSIMPTLNGTTALDWAKKLFFGDASYDAVERAIKEVPAGSRGILFLPYLYGERAPFRNPFASGSFHGLTASHTGADLCRAVYEGLAMNILECYESLPPVQDGIAVSGGGAASNELCGILADSMGKEVLRPSSAELGIQGIASVVAEALGKGPIAANGQEAVCKFLPRQSNQTRYHQLFDSFCRMRHNMEAIWSNGKGVEESC